MPSAKQIIGLMLSVILPPNSRPHVLVAKMYADHRASVKGYVSREQFSNDVTHQIFPTRRQAGIHETMTRTKKVLLGIATLLIAGAAAIVGSMGPSNVIGMLRYDQRAEGQLKVGDMAPDVTLVAIDAGRQEKLLAHVGGRPLVVIFGSFT